MAELFGVGYDPRRRGVGTRAPTRSRADDLAGHLRLLGGCQRRDHERGRSPSVASSTCRSGTAITRHRRRHATNGTASPRPCRRTRPATVTSPSSISKGSTNTSSASPRRTRRPSSTTRSTRCRPQAMPTIRRPTTAATRERSSTRRSTRRSDRYFNRSDVTSVWYTFVFPLSACTATRTRWCGPSTTCTRTG